MAPGGCTTFRASTKCLFSPPLKNHRAPRTLRVHPSFHPPVRHSPPSAGERAVLAGRWCPWRGPSGGRCEPSRGGGALCWLVPAAVGSSETGERPVPGAWRWLEHRWFQNRALRARWLFSRLKPALKSVAKRKGGIKSRLTSWDLWRPWLPLRGAFRHRRSQSGGDLCLEREQGATKPLFVFMPRGLVFNGSWHAVAVRFGRV